MPVEFGLPWPGLRPGPLGTLLVGVSRPDRVAVTGVVCVVENPLCGPPQTVSSLSCVPFSIDHRYSHYSLLYEHTCHIHRRTYLSFPITTVRSRSSL